MQRYRSDPSVRQTPRGGRAPAPEKQVQTSLAQPIDCSTAQADVKTLTSEKTRTSREIENRVSSLIPIGAVAYLRRAAVISTLDCAGVYCNALCYPVA